MKRGEIWWATLPTPRASEPGYRRPVLIVGNVILRKRESRLGKDSVINVSQLVTLSKEFLVDRVGRIPPARIREVEGGLRLVLSL